MRTFLKTGPTRYSSHWTEKQVYGSNRSPDSDHVHAVYPKMTGQVVALALNECCEISLWSPQGASVTKYHKGTLNTGTVWKEGSNKHHITVEELHWTLSCGNVNLLLVFWLMRKQCYHHKEGPLFYKMYLLLHSAAAKPLQWCRL